MRIHSRNNRVKFHSDRIWNNWALGFLVASPQQDKKKKKKKKNNNNNSNDNKNNKMSSDMRSDTWSKKITFFSTKPNNELTKK